MTPWLQDGMLPTRQSSLQILILQWGIRQHHSWIMMERREVLAVLVALLIWSTVDILMVQHRIWVIIVGMICIWLCIMVGVGVVGT